MADDSSLITIPGSAEFEQTLRRARSDNGLPSQIHGVSTDEVTRRLEEAKRVAAEDKKHILSDGRNVQSLDTNELISMYLALTDPAKTLAEEGQQKSLRTQWNSTLDSLVGNVGQASPFQDKLTAAGKILDAVIKAWYQLNKGLEIQGSTERYETDFFRETGLANFLANQPYEGNDYSKLLTYIADIDCRTVV